MARHARLVMYALTIACAAAVLALAGCGPAPTRHSGGGPIREWGTSQATAPTRLRVATFNIHSGEGRDGRPDINRVARLLRGFHVVGLNEVRGDTREPEMTQPEILARLTGTRGIFAPVERDRLGHWAFGNGVLTVLPVRHWQQLPISADNAESNRNVLLVRIPHGERTINVLVTHLGRAPRDRPRQLSAVGELFLALQPPAILMGDLNTTRDDEQLRRLIATAGHRAVPGEDLDPDGTAIDWILVRGLRVVDSGMIDEGASDHPMVWAELELPDDAGVR